MDNINKFFETYQKANDNFDIDLIGSCYGESFLFGQPQGVQTVAKSAFLSVLPKRKGFFQMIGLQSSKIYSIEKRELDSRYIEVQVQWKMQFKKETKNIEDITKATYILYRDVDNYKIVVQIDHQDLMERVKKLGLQ